MWHGIEWMRGSECEYLSCGCRVGIDVPFGERCDVSGDGDGTAHY